MGLAYQYEQDGDWMGKMRSRNILSCQQMESYHSTSMVFLWFDLCLDRDRQNV